MHLVTSHAPEERSSARRIAEMLEQDDFLDWGEAQCRRALKLMGWSKKKFSDIASQRFKPWNQIRTAILNFRMACRRGPSFLRLF